MDSGTDLREAQSHSEDHKADHVLITAGHSMIDVEAAGVGDMHRDRIIGEDLLRTEAVVVLVAP